MSLSWDNTKEVEKYMDSVEVKDKPNVMDVVGMIVAKE